MLKLFQSIFGHGEEPGRHPESLIEAAIERAVDGTDPRLRTLPGYRKLLRQPVVNAVDHVIALIDGLPEALVANRTAYGDDRRLTALFASSDRMLEVFGADTALSEFREGRSAAGGQATALLLAERVERQVMGMELDGDLLRREVAQVSVNFRGHRLVDPGATEEETRRQLKRRAFDHLLSLGLQQVAETQSQRADLGRQRKLLRDKLEALRRGNWSFDTADAPRPDPAALRAELEATEQELTALGVDERTLHANLEIVAAVLSDAARQLWAGRVDLHIDRMNIQRDAGNNAARQVSLHELQNARGRRLVMLLVSITLAELPQRDDFFRAAERLLGPL